MIEQLTFGDVTSYRLSWWRSRAIGYSVCVYHTRGVLIDSGFPAAHRDVAHIVKEQHVRGAIITHQHEDHAGNVAMLVRRGVPMAMHPDTLAAIRHPHRIGLYRHITWQAMHSFDTPVERFVDAAFSLEPTPGHSPEHHSVWDRETGTLFAGDLFLGVKVKVAHSYESPAAHIASLHRMLALNPARIFCAHRGLLKYGASMLAAKADWMSTLIDTVLRLAREGYSFTAIRERALGPRDTSHWVSVGDYSPDNLVRAILRDARVTV